MGRRRANLIGYSLRTNCLLKHIIEGKIEVKGREGRRRKHLSDDKEKRSYCNLKQKEALDPTQ